ncbi:fibronectin type III domain-containing protein 5-like isoform X4 [Brienomyrus brachyistius]|uniref:fibronectin type III domain-containing protein 5-like isoform X4 n=1 Tax=Brienomyrus brachyistius TaxID=42636 RepID=UPI0020B20F81|nr:fibronectin type III domain-containing protein 5-like isoform X4 [Brienomyrus brachyistius]
MERFFPSSAALLILGCLGVSRVQADNLTRPVNVTVKALTASSAVVTWDIPEGAPIIGFAITQQKKDVRMLRFIQEVNTTSRYCALWDLEEDTDYTVHVQAISMWGPSPPSTPLRFRTPKEAEKQASKTKDEVTMEEVGQSPELQAGELIIILVVLLMWAGERVIIIVVELIMWAGERVIIIVVELIMWAGERVVIIIMVELLMWAGESVVIIIMVELLMWAGERVVIIVVELLMWTGERVVIIVVELLMWAGERVIIIVVVLLMWTGERVVIIVVELLMWTGERVVIIVVEQVWTVDSSSAFSNIMF